MTSKKAVLPIIVLSQFFCTSLWFVGNAIISDLVISFNLNPLALGYLTSALQFGFIIGTFIFAILTIADRYSASKVFFVSAVVAAFFNVLIAFGSHTLLSLIVLRFLTGFFLAGIYPVGMKIASDYFEKGLGKSLGFLVGALVLGTAFPHVLKGFTGLFFWEHMLYVTSGLAVLGGVLVVLLVPDGPYKKTLPKFDVSICYKVFKLKTFRSAAFGYFGHMWELYAFWAFVPVFLKAYSSYHSLVDFNIPLYSFYSIAIGSLGCVISGYLSQRFSSKKVAATALALSGLCCLVSPLFFMINSEITFLLFLMFWGMVVIADSPLFSTLVAQNVDAASKGTALTIVNSIGFAITIISIQLLNYLQTEVEAKYLFLVLAIGPVLGLYALYNKS
ncbi:MFS transporter [Algibacter amylolyticus]|uniref:MFS transporter n=1 Tax=Algibacter amylolyticus TaxID=1608400 RepID=A0A5M7B507_9FLAO|nr:MFS transporter [Algibacter amylolyticus]KAA5822405.1 MFS transporter [Algibacter amylolyticus]MBB5269124.1 MFS family permease [Algibacter amylolyticus]TSJ73555.1 MFS transporter [Algibacter amylolyticus]